MCGFFCVLFFPFFACYLFHFFLFWFVSLTRMYIYIFIYLFIDLFIYLYFFFIYIYMYKYIYMHAPFDRSRVSPAPRSFYDLLTRRDTRTDPQPRSRRSSSRSSRPPRCLRPTIASFDEETARGDDPSLRRPPHPSDRVPLPATNRRARTTIPRLPAVLLVIVPSSSVIVPSPFRHRPPE